MAKVGFREATAEDILFVGSRLRAADRAEVIALGADPAFAVRCSALFSDEAWTGLIDGVPSMVFGVGQPIFGPASVWALGTDNCTEHPREMLRFGRDRVRDFLTRYPEMENWCDARYSAAIRWLRRIGFNVSDPEPRGMNGELFCRLFISREGR